MGERDLVFQNNNQNVTTNGVTFYFSQMRSMGFVPQGSVPQLNSCDTGNERPELRMCWHTVNGSLGAGYRCGNNSLNAGGNWERVIYTSR